MWKLLIVGKNYGNLSDEKLEEFGKGMLRVIRFVGTRLGFGPGTVRNSVFGGRVGRSPRGPPHSRANGREQGCSWFAEEGIMAPFFGGALPRHSTNC